MTCIIDTKTKEEQTLLLRNKLILDSAIFKKSLSSKNLSCDINNIVKMIKDPSEKNWQVVTILKNATIMDKTNILGLILEYAVTIGEINEIIMPVSI